MVLQETWLKTGTVRENLTMGDADASEEKMIEAAKAAHCHSFIKRLPQGYDTVIGEGGAELSQGQRQLLCIARVMLCLPPMLILDEATSSIDTRTEMKIQSAFGKMMQGRTSFIGGAPSLDDTQRRRHHRDEGRSHHRDRKPRGTARKGRILRETLQQPVRGLIRKSWLSGGRLTATDFYLKHFPEYSTAELEKTTVLCYN